MRCASKNLMTPRQSPAVLSIAAVVLTLSVSIAWATSGTGSQNPNLTVSVSLSPDVVNVGDTLTGSGSVTNNTTARRRVAIVATFTLPNGASYTESKSLRLGAGKTHSLSQSEVIPNGAPSGQYTLTLSATDNNGTSSATATATVP
jgi:hypothetical protein